MKLTLKTMEIDALSDAGETELHMITGTGCVYYCKRVGDLLVCDEKVCDGGPRPN